MTSTRDQVAAALRLIRESDQKFDKKISLIIERDTRHQEALAARGGTVTSALSEAADAAAREVQRQKAAARLALARPALAALDADDARVTSEAYSAARAWLTVRNTKMNLDAYANSLRELVGADVSPSLAASVDAAEFVARVDQEQISLALATKRRDVQPLAQPKYSDLVAS